MTAIDAAFWGFVSAVPLVVGAFMALRFNPSNKIVTFGFAPLRLFGYGPLKSDISL